MILRALQIVTFVFAATIEVKVHAAQVVSLRTDSSPLQEPVDCLELEERCAIKTAPNRKYQLEVGKSFVTLGSNTSIVRSSSNKIILVTGTNLVKSEGAFFVEVEYGKVIFKDAQAILVRQEEKLSVSVISGEVFLQPRGFENMLRVEPGQQNTLSSVNRTGVAQIGVATPVEFEGHALLWSSLYSGKKKIFQKELKEFALVWKSASEKVASEHRQLAQRRIASLEEEHQKQQAELRRKQAYENELRSLFRKKSLDQ